MIRNLKPRCCGLLRTTSALLSGSKTGRYGVYQRTEGPYMSIEDGAIDGDFDVRDWFCVELVVRLTSSSRRRGNPPRRGCGRSLLGSTRPAHAPTRGYCGGEVFAG